MSRRCSIGVDAILPRLRGQSPASTAKSCCTISCDQVNLPLLIIRECFGKSRQGSGRQQMSFIALVHSSDFVDPGRTVGAGGKCQKTQVTEALYSHAQSHDCWYTVSGTRLCYGFRFLTSHTSRFNTAQRTHHTHNSAYNSSMLGEGPTGTIRVGLICGCDQ